MIEVDALSWDERLERWVHVDLACEETIDDLIHLDDVVWDPAELDAQP